VSGNAGLTKDARPARPSAIAGYEDWPAYVQGNPRYQAASAAAQELADALGVPGAMPSPDVTVHWEETPRRRHHLPAQLAVGLRSPHHGLADSPGRS
jgi:hypothetical protein